MPIWNGLGILILFYLWHLSILKIDNGLIITNYDYGESIYKLLHKKSSKIKSPSFIRKHKFFNSKIIPPN